MAEYYYMMPTREHGVVFKCCATNPAFHETIQTEDCDEVSEDERQMIHHIRVVHGIFIGTDCVKELDKINARRKALGEFTG